MDNDSLTVAVAQMTSVDSLMENMKFIKQGLSQFLPGQVDLFCFPENVLYLRVQEGEAMAAFELEDECFQELAEMAKGLKAHLHLGSVPLKIDGKLYNSSVWISDKGVISSGYQKIHLFDIALEGKKPLRESDVFARGAQPHIYELKGWRLGESICYDLRFSELYRHYGQRGVDALLIPSSFLVETGRAHWEVLLRARAIENQTFVIASAQGGLHQSVKTEAQRYTYGHSMIVDPWGRVAMDRGEEKGFSVVTLDRKEINKTRLQIPMVEHRKQRKAAL